MRLILIALLMAISYAQTDCVVDSVATKASCTLACGEVPAVETTPASDGGNECAAYECKHNDGECVIKCSSIESELNAGGYYNSAAWKISCNNPNYEYSDDAGESFLVWCNLDCTPDDVAVQGTDFAGCPTEDVDEGMYYYAPPCLVASMMGIPAKEVFILDVQDSGPQTFTSCSANGFTTTDHGGYASPYTYKLRQCEQDVAANPPSEDAWTDQWHDGIGDCVAIGTLEKHTPLGSMGSGPSPIYYDCSDGADKGYDASWYGESHVAVCTQTCTAETDEEMDGCPITGTKYNSRPCMAAQMAGVTPGDHFIMDTFPYSAFICEACKPNSMVLGVETVTDSDEWYMYKIRHCALAAPVYIDGVLVWDVDCLGTWSACTDACEMTDSRTFTETQAKNILGAECTAKSGNSEPYSADCVAGEDACVVLDCQGTWSECTDACESAGDRTWTETQAGNRLGASCPTATDCKNLEGDCANQGPWILKNLETVVSLLDNDAAPWRWNKAWLEDTLGRLAYTGGSDVNPYRPQYKEWLKDYLCPEYSEENWNALRDKVNTFITDHMISFEP